MSIQRYEGFDHFADTGTNPADLLAKNFGVDPLATFTYGAGQFAGSSLDTSAATDILIVPYVDAVTESFVGFWVNIAAAPASAATILAFHSADTVLANPHLSLVVNTDLSVQVYHDGSTSLGTSAAAALATSTWQFIEMQALIHASTGAFDVHIEEVSVVSGTGVDTTAAASTDYNVNAIRLIGAATMLPRFDDLYIVDTTVLGTHPITFLNKITVATLFPDADGFQTDFTPVGSGSFNFDRVHETPAKNDDTNYVQSSTVGDIDSYGMDNIPGAYAGKFVMAVQTTAAVRKTTPGAKKIRTTIRSNVTDVTGDTIDVTAGYKYLLPQIEVIDPDTAIDWTLAGVNAMEAGIELMT